GRAAPRRGGAGCLGGAGDDEEGPSRPRALRPGRGGATGGGRAPAAQRVDDARGPLLAGAAHRARTHGGGGGDATRPGTGQAGMGGGREPERPGRGGGG